MMWNLSKLATVVVEVANANLKNTVAAKQNQPLVVDVPMRVAQTTKASMMKEMSETTIVSTGEDATTPLLTNSKRREFLCCGSDLIFDPCNLSAKLCPQIR